MRDVSVSVQVALGGKGKSFLDRSARWRRLVILAVWLMSYCSPAWGPAATAEESAPKTGTDRGAGKDQPGSDQPSPPAAPPATIEGFRQARFGMSEEQVRQAIRKDFPAPAAKLTSAVHPSEKTTVLSLLVADLLPRTGNARIFYILGHRRKKLSQINIVWSSDGSTAAAETVVGTANSLRDYFVSENFKPDSVVANQQIAPNTILVFRGSDDQKRTVLLVLSGVAASACSEERESAAGATADPRTFIYRGRRTPRRVTHRQRPVLICGTLTELLSVSTGTRHRPRPGSE